MSKNPILEGKEKIQTLVNEKLKNYALGGAAAILGEEGIQEKYNQQKDALNAQIDAELNKMSDAVKGGQANTCANYNRAS